MIAGQFVNPANPEAHRRTTGPEIWNDTDGDVDAFVAGVGTGGTITGVGEYLKSKNDKIEIIAVEPATSPVLSQGKPGPHKIQGIGAGFVPEILNTKIYDSVVPVDNDDAFEYAKLISHTEEFRLEYQRAQHFTQQLSGLRSQRTKVRQSLHCFRTVVTDITQHHFLRTNNRINVSNMDIL